MRTQWWNLEKQSRKTYGRIIRRFNSVSTFWQANMAMEDRHFIVFQWADTPIANLDSKRVLKISSQHPETSAAYGICSFLGPQKWGKHRWTRLVDAAKLSLRPSLWNLWAGSWRRHLFWSLNCCKLQEMRIVMIQKDGEATFGFLQAVIRRKILSTAGSSKHHCEQVDWLGFRLQC